VRLSRDPRYSPTTITNATPPPQPHRGASKTGLAGGGNLVWDGLDLRLGKRGRVLATVVPDNKYSKMWRVGSSEGLSDLANKTWAKDAALVIAGRILNQGVVR